MSGTATLLSKYGKAGTKVYTVGSTKEFLTDFFNDRIILWSLSPPRSPDLTPPGFFLLGYINDRIFQVEPASINHLKELITNVMATIDQNMLKKVFWIYLSVLNFIKRLEVAILNIHCNVIIKIKICTFFPNFCIFFSALVAGLLKHPVVLLNAKGIFCLWKMT